MNLEDEVCDLAIAVNLRGAQLEALQCIICALVPLVIDKGRFIEGLKVASDAMTARRLNDPGICDEYIAAFREQLLALTPVELRGQLH
jgi:hypothetical protein